MGVSISSLQDSALNANGKPTLSIFGYGSLLWNPGFAFDHQRKVISRGYGRRFYQGNTTFRGTEECPGRVVTLVEDEKSHTYGLVFTVIGRRKIFAALEHLYEREIENGYFFQMVTVECLESGEISQALTCIASPNNVWYLGPPPVEKLENSTECQIQRQIALDIASARGNAGPNYEYLFKLAATMRKLFPQANDDELFQLETYVISFLNNSKISTV